MMESKGWPGSIEEGGILESNEEIGGLSGKGVLAREHWR